MIVCLASLLASAACRGAPRRPARPGPDPVAERLTDPHQLKPYLEAYPLGDSATRVDLLGSDRDRSLHLVQTRGDIALHTHPHAIETAYVLTGHGTVRIEDREYRALPGAAFKIAAGVPHSVHPDAGETLIAVVYYDPPQGEVVERESVPQ